MRGSRLRAVVGRRHVQQVRAGPLVYLEGACVVSRTERTGIGSQQSEQGHHEQHELILRNGSLDDW